MCQELTTWEKAVEFHRHECSGLAIGVRAVEAAKVKMRVAFFRMRKLSASRKTMPAGWMPSRSWRDAA